MKRIIQWSIEHYWLVMGLSLVLFAAGAWTARGVTNGPAGNETLATRIIGSP